MNEQELTNLPASVLRRLLNLSHERNLDYNLILTRFAAERLLYRLSRSQYAGRFVLKGALMLVLWIGQSSRPTRDVDLLGYGTSSQEALARVFRDICGTDVEPDGLVFDPQAVRVTEIREAQEYGGQRVHLLAMLGKARIDLQVDIGFGDAVRPRPELVEYPTLLGFAAPRLRVYRPETAIAEKLHAMVTLGAINSRMKDFYDIWLLARHHDFDGSTLAEAIQATFTQRSVALSPLQSSFRMAL